MNSKSLVMLFGKNNTLIFKILGFILLLFHGLLQSSGHYHHFVVEEAPYTRLCSTKNILTVNGQFPGPTLYAHKFDTIYVKVLNRGKENITIHWHGVKQPRNPWADGPEYITQCPIKPGDVFKYKIKFSTEEGTLWWHAHSDWSRATVHGAIVVHPKKGTHYPFHKPHIEVPIILGEWWKMDVMEVLKLMVITGGAPNVSDAFTINGQPGDLYPCSNLDTFKLTVDYGKKYLLRMVNANLNEILFFAIANHRLTVVGSDGSYTKPLTRDYITIAPGQTIDALFHANQRSDDRYYMAGRAYSSSAAVPFDNTTTTAIVQYSNIVNYTTTSTPPPLFPYLPYYNDTIAAINFTTAIRSLANHHHPIKVPQTITTRMFSTISINSFPCEKINGSCEGPNGTRLAASVTNISFVTPPIDILEAYYYHIRGVYGNHFPNFPPLIFNFTSEDLPLSLQTPRRGTEVKVLDYNSTVEIVFQNTRLLGGLDHPMHLHGYSFYVVGWGFGNFDKDEDPLRYNLVDPPLRNTVIVPLGGWTAIRFKAKNPGVWFMHCHFERHLTWGMDMAFIVKDGDTPDSRMHPRPAYMPPC